MKNAKFQCRTQHFMWCNDKTDVWHLSKALGFNAARSILCGATMTENSSFMALFVSMPHAAFYVVQHAAVFRPVLSVGFNAARSILCGAT